MDGTVLGVYSKTESPSSSRRMDLGQAAENVMEVGAHYCYIDLVCDHGIVDCGTHRHMWMAHLLFGTEAAKLARAQCACEKLLLPEDLVVVVDEDASIDLVEAVERVIELFPVHAEYVKLLRKDGIFGARFLRFIWTAQLKFGSRGAEVARVICVQVARNGQRLN